MAPYQQGGLIEGPWIPVLLPLGLSRRLISIASGKTHKHSLAAEIMKARLSKEDRAFVVENGYEIGYKIERFKKPVVAGM